MHRDGPRGKELFQDHLGLGFSSTYQTHQKCSEYQGWMSRNPRTKTSQYTCGNRLSKTSNFVLLTLVQKYIQKTYPLGHIFVRNHDLRTFADFAPQPNHGLPPWVRLYKVTTFQFARSNPKTLYQLRVDTQCARFAHGEAGINKKWLVRVQQIVPCGPRLVQVDCLNVLNHRLFLLTVYFLALGLSPTGYGPFD